MSFPANSSFEPPRETAQPAATKPTTANVGMTAFQRIRRLDPSAASLMAAAGGRFSAFRWIFLACARGSDGVFGENFVAVVVSHDCVPRVGDEEPFLGSHIRWIGRPGADWWACVMRVAVPISPGDSARVSARILRS